MTYNEVIEWLYKSKIVHKKKNHNIISKNSLGIHHNKIKKKAEKIGKNSTLALKLFDSNIYEARIFCSKIYDPKDVTEDLAEKWVKTFENPEICDVFSIGLFAKSSLAVSKALEWSIRQKEFEKRAGFIIMMAYSTYDNNVDNDVFKTFLSIIKNEAHDERIYVKKAINWALKNIGKRNSDLNNMAITLSYQIIQYGSESAKWVGVNALKELQCKTLTILGYPKKI